MGNSQYRAKQQGNFKGKPHLPCHWSETQQRKGNRLGYLLVELGALGRGGCFVLFQVVKGKVMAGSNICKKAEQSPDNGESAWNMGAKVSPSFGQNNCSGERPLNTTCRQTPLHRTWMMGMGIGCRGGKGKGRLKKFYWLIYSALGGLRQYLKKVYKKKIFIS